MHEFNHANVVADPYVASANLPIRVGMTCSDTVTATMNFVCCSVVAEGGQENAFSYEFAVEGTGTAGNGTAAHILSIRPLTTFNGIANRSKITIGAVDVLVTGDKPVKWELCLGQAISGTTAFTAVNNTYSTVEFNTAGTISGAPVIVIASGYVAATNQAKSSTRASATTRYPITLNAAGAVRALGTLSLILTGIGGTSTVRASFGWSETR